jgi:hypothetical protein
MKPKIKIVHLLCRPTHDREVASIASIAPLNDLGIKYVQHCNRPTYQFPPDAINCRRFHDLSFTFAPGKLWPGHYGAWQAHLRAFQYEFTEDLDFFMIAECDCILRVSPEIFAREVFDSADYMANRDVEYLSFGGHNVNSTNDRFIEHNPEGWTIVSHIFKTHCIMFTRATRDFVLRSFYTAPWDNIDFWYNSIYQGHRIAIHNEILAEQWVGGSLVDLKE